MKSISPPKQLKTAGKALYRALVREYSITDGGGLALLTAGCEALDRQNQARERIEADGPYLADRFGQLRAHAAVAVERDARGQLLQALKQLCLDVGPVRALSGRPGHGFGITGDE